MSQATSPVISVVVVIVSDTVGARAQAGHLGDCLEALSHQTAAPETEIIVPHHLEVDGLEEIKQRFPEVKFIPVPEIRISGRRGGGREHHDTLRATGMAAARGALIGILEDHAKPDPGWCAQVAATHREAYAAVGGAIENGIDRPLNWAVYFCDFGKYQNPLPAGETTFASDANVTYKRAALESVRETWTPNFREVVVNGALRERGEKLALDPKMVVYQNRTDLRLGTALSERYVWGRSYAATRNALLSGPKRLFLAALSPILPAVLTLRLAKIAWERRRNFGKFLTALPYTLLLTVVWSLGEGIGYLFGIPAGAAET